MTEQDKIKYETAFTMATSSIKYGPGVTREVGYDMKKLGSSRVMVVTDPNLSDSEPVTVSLQALREVNIETVLFDRARVEPTDTSFKEVIKFASSGNFDGFIGIGGGSSMDTAKIANLFSTYPAELLTYVNAPIGKGQPVPGPLKPMIAIPTTAGTGSEVTIWAVITNTKDNYKMAPGGWKLLPKVALVDPMMTVSMPPLLTAATGMDALSHAVEAYCNVAAMPQTDALAMAAIRLIAKHLGPAAANGSNIEAREGMAMASLEAGMAFSSAGCGGIHALGHQLSSQCGMPHGMAMAIMMPPLMKFNLIACVDRLADIAAAMGEKIEGLSKREAAEKTSLAVRQLSKSIGLPTTLTEYGADSKLIPSLAKWALKDGDLPGNPRVPTLEQIEELYKEAFTGSLD